MICKLTGVIDDIFDDGVAIDVGGVCYFVYAPTNLLANLNRNCTASIVIYHIFKQDSQILCGFNDLNQMRLFKMLLDVQGVGVKSAMSILSKLVASDLLNAVLNQDHTLLCLADGIGKKTAQRIISELKDRDLSFISASDVISGDNHNEAVLALVSLGYGRDEAYRLVGEALQNIDKNSDTNAIVVECLRMLKS